MRRLFVQVVVVALTAATFFSACCPNRRLSAGVRDSVRVEVRTREVLVRDTVCVQLPAEVVEKVTPDTTATAETSIARALASVSAGLLSLKLENKPDAIRAPVEQVLIHRDSVIYRYRENTIEVPAQLTWWQRVRLSLCNIMLFALFGLLVAALVRRRFMRK